MFLRSNELSEVYMSEFDLSGFKLCHVDDDMHSVLYEQRVIHGMTQKQVAEKAKITLQQYQKFESGARNIMTCSFRIACRVIEALGMNISDFYHGEYVIGEEVYLVGKKLYYKKTNRPVDEDVTDE
jgi:transcriptional regulator with XRE-family HTH domain